MGMKRREWRANNDDNYRRWWATDDAPSPAMLALLVVIGLAGLFAVASTVIEAIVKQ
jgi:hypothetical protein